MIVLISFLIFVLVGMLYVSVTWKPRTFDLEKRLSLDNPASAAVVEQKVSIDQREKMLHKSGSSPLMDMLVKALGDKYKSLLPAGVYENYTKKLSMAGMKQQVSEILVQKVIMSFIFFGLTSFLVVWKGMELSGKTVLMIVGSFLLGFFLPDMQIKQNIQKRHSQIEKIMPFTLDILKICVEAGLDMNSAFGRVVDKTNGPLSEELSKMLTEIRMGKQRGQAMLDMANGVGQPDLSSFTTIVVQGERMGMSMGKILSMQSAQIRKKSAQRIKEQAAKIPVKMMIPMVLFILPAMFAILLGPAAISIVGNF